MPLYRRIPPVCTPRAYSRLWFHCREINEPRAEIYIYIYISSSSFLIHQINFLPIFLFRLFDYCLLVQGYSLLRIVIMECKSDQAKRRWLLRKSGERMDEYFFEFWISVLEFEIILWKKKKERKNEKNYDSIYVTHVFGHVSIFKEIVCRPAEKFVNPINLGKGDYIHYSWIIANTWKF